MPVKKLTQQEIHDKLWRYSSDNDTFSEGSINGDKLQAKQDKYPIGSTYGDFKLLCYISGQQVYMECTTCGTAKRPTISKLDKTTDLRCGHKFGSAPLQDRIGLKVGDAVVISGDAEHTRLKCKCGVEWDSAITTTYQFKRIKAECGDNHLRPKYPVESSRYQSAMARAGKLTSSGKTNYLHTKFLFTSFKEFIEEVGEIPDPSYELDRINTFGDYEKGNVRWVPKEVNAWNIKSSKLLGVPRYDGTRLKPLSEILEAYNRGEGDKFRLTCSCGRRMLLIPGEVKAVAKRGCVH